MCSSNRSVVIANSVRKIKDRGSLPSIRGELEPLTPSVPGKLRPCISRDSGIVENEIPHGHNTDFSRGDYDLNSPGDADASSESDDEIVFTDKGSVSKLRPHSCRLGVRRRKQPVEDTNLVPEDRLVRMLRATRSLDTEGDFDENIPSSRMDDGYNLNEDDRFYDKYNNNSVQFNNNSYKRRSSSRLRSGKSVSRRSTTTGSDVDSYSDSETYSDSDFWTIPDETGMSDQNQKVEERNRKGWVNRDDGNSYETVSSSGSMTPTPRSSQTLDYYRIVSDSYKRYGANLHKKASERSISSIILMPIDDTYQSTNMEWYHEPSNSFPSHLQRVSVYTGSCRESPVVYIALMHVYYIQCADECISFNSYNLSTGLFKET